MILREIYRVLDTNRLLCSCLRVSLKEIEVSSKFRSEVSAAGNRLGQFCFEFDEIQPIQTYSDEKICYCSRLTLLYVALFKVISMLIKWLISYDETALATLEWFLERFYLDIKRISDEDIRDSIDVRLVTYRNIDTEKFSIFNLPHRVFVDIFMDCLLKDTLTTKIRDQVFGDDKMLMWIGRPAITATSFFAKVLASKPENDRVKDYVSYAYMNHGTVHYLFMQDFNAIQILISYLDPELFLKYMLFNFVPSIRKRVCFSENLTSIFRLNEFDDGCHLHQLLLLIYNALAERHFVGVSDNPEYQLLERQIIHSIASGYTYQTVEDIKTSIFVYREIYFLELTYSTYNLDEMIQKVSYTINSPDLRNTISLKPEYLNTVNMFYFMYQYSKSACVHEKLVNLYKINQWKFQLPDLVEMRENFEGMNNFLFSDAFSDLILHILVKWYANLGTSDTGIIYNLILVSMTLCFILKVSLNQTIDSRFHKAVDFIFGIRKDLGENNVMTILALFKKRLVDDVFGSVVDYLMELSKIPTDYFTDLSETPADMMEKPRVSRDLGFKMLGNKYQEIHRRHEKSQKR
ncbi:hypothetical protein RF11_07873 [Thelohanellus kitauei]|uniref:Uncharacterized protein n=1 Tax=Thelohanellus kitauei TaxID=669202 RepID=A0A0C2J280_THEKT|nr:hypothetical protein RF11_07873 [Thelohanellus kitauei]